MARDKKYGIYFIPNEHKEYEEEPIFIIRGKDKAAPAAIRAYGNAALENGSSPVILADCLTRADEIEEWQERNKDIVKAAD